MKEKNIKILFAALLGLISLASIELISGYASWINSSRGKSGFFNLSSNLVEKLSSGPHTNETVTASYWPSSPFIPHPKYGYWHKPGRTVVTLESSAGPKYSFEMNFNPDGTRSSSSANRKFLEAGNVNNEKEFSVWIFGDSYLEGYGLNDEVVFSSLLQSMRPEIEVKNFAGSGFGNSHALLQLMDLKSKGLNPPQVIIVGYGDYYPQRNVAAPMRLKTYSYNSESEGFVDSSYRPEEFLHPRALLDENGHLKVELIPLFGEVDRSDLYETTLQEQMQITIEVLRSFYDLSKEWGVQQLFIANLNGGHTDAVISSAEDMGFLVLDLRRNQGLFIDGDSVPLDGHPGPLAHNMYARKIDKVLTLMDVQGK